jgi:hypothetical protein
MISRQGGNVSFTYGDKKADQTVSFEPVIFAKQLDLTIAVLGLILPQAQHLYSSTDRHIHRYFNDRMSTCRGTWGWRSSV